MQYAQRMKRGEKTGIQECDEEAKKEAGVMYCSN